MEQHDRSHHESRKVALCGMMAALSVVILCLGGLVPLATFACPMLAMLCLIPTVCGYGTGTSLLLYAASAILGLLLCPDKEIAFLYVIIVLSQHSPRYWKQPQRRRVWGKAARARSGD